MNLRIIDLTITKVRILLSIGFYSVTYKNEKCNIAFYFR